MKTPTLCALALTTTLGLHGCQSTEDSINVGANPNIVDRSSSALSTGTLQWANGTYDTNCTTHSGASWSLQIAGGSLTMDHTALSVVKNNTTCGLSLTSLVTDENTKTTYAASPAIAVGASYAGSPSSFSSDSGTTIAFYGNAMMSPADFSSNFTMTILYSDNPSLATGAVTGVYTTVAASSATQNIAAPNYTLDLSTGVLTVSVDNAFIVQSVSGTAILDASSVFGNSYYVDQGALASSPTFDQLNTAYQSASTTTISGSGNVTINASAFGLSGVDLSSTVYRTIVIQRLVSGVASYQTFRIGFSHP